MGQLFAQVLSFIEIPARPEVKDAAGVVTQEALGEARTYRLSIKANSKFGTASIYWVTKQTSEGKYAVNETDILDSDMFYAIEKTNKNGQVIKILKSKNVQLL